MRFFQIPGERVFPEGITEGPGTTFFVGSLEDGSIYRGDTACGQIELFLPPDGDGRGNICGLAVDGRGRLVSCDMASGSLFVHDLATRSLVARRPLPAGKAMPNDVVIDGAVAFATDSYRPVVWRLPLGDSVGEPSVCADLANAGAAPDAYLNGIACPPGGPLLVSGQGEGAGLWRADPDTGEAVRVDLDGYEFNADGMLLDGDLLYGVTNRGESIQDVQFQISVVRLEPGWRSGRLVGQLADQAWIFPTTIARVGDELLVVCAQLGAMQAATAPDLPFVIAAIEFPRWP